MPINITNLNVTSEQDWQNWDRFTTFRQTTITTFKDKSMGSKNYKA